MRRLALAALLLLCACGSVARSGAVASPSPAPLSRADLQYRVVDTVGAPVYCDPFQYPVARTEDPADAARMVAALRAQRPDEFSAIVRHEHLPGDKLSAADNLRILTQAAMLGAVPLTAYGSAYTFAYEVVGAPTAQVRGTVDAVGAVTVTSRAPAPHRLCPVCLAQWTRIDTPGGRVPVTELRPGTMVWTLDAKGRRVAAPVLAVGRTATPAGHLVVHLALADGRGVDVSPGHPLPDARPVGELRPGDRLDGSTVASAELRPYGGAATWDLLPAGPTHLYWANGILLGSTLAQRSV